MAYGTRKFIATVTKDHRRVLSWARSSQFSSKISTSRRSLLRVSSQRCVGLPNGLFSSGFPTKTEYSLLFLPSELHDLPILVVAISLFPQNRVSRTVREVFSKQSPLFPSHLVPFRPVYLSQNHVFKHSYFMFIC